MEKQPDWAFDACARWRFRVCSAAGAYIRSCPILRVRSLIDVFFNHFHLGNRTDGTSRRRIPARGYSTQVRRQIDVSWTRARTFFPHKCVETTKSFKIDNWLKFCFCFLADTYDSKSTAGWPETIKSKGITRNWVALIETIAEALGAFERTADYGRGLTDIVNRETVKWKYQSEWHMLFRFHRNERRNGPFPFTSF